MNKFESVELVSSELKTVDYFGLTLIVPKEFKYIATDENGSVCVFLNQPEVGEYIFTAYGYYYQIGEIKYKGDWKNL